MKFERKQPSRRGFSLVELLIVIVVLGIISSIALASMSNVNTTSRTVVAQAQAQRIAGTFAAGQAAEAPGFRGIQSVADAINAVGTGSNGGGAYASSYFQLPGVSAAMDAGKPADEQAAHYLQWESGLLTYHAAGAPTAQ